jgi:hypothetical protein
MSAESLATLQSRLAAIRKAYHTGVLTVTHGDTTTTFRSLQAMKEIIASLEQEIAGKEGRTRRKVRYLYQSGKGL